ncbi:MAG: carbamoyltransferase C-terminal domain-containing protein [Bdellovibrionales bacterium]
MNILGIHAGRLASACLARENHVVGAASQERFDSLKGSDTAPMDVVRWLLAREGLDETAIDCVAISSAPVSLELDIEPEKIRYIDQTTAHAYAPLAFFGAPQEPTLIFVADTQSTALYLWDQNKLSPLAHGAGVLGTFYANVTSALGMAPYAHEGKVMGLAAYAKEDDFIPVYKKLYAHLWAINEDHLVPVLRQDSNSIASPTRFDHMAGAAQHALETTVHEWIRAAIKKTGISRLMTSGGVFTNVRLNKMIREMPEVTKAQFTPSCGNEMNVFGALYAVAPTLSPIQHLYWGPDYSDQDIASFLKAEAQDFAITHCEDIEKRTASLLAKGKIVARFSGRAEFGARSLGNRAILAHPAQREAFYQINDQIKLRDFWMPFAPTILDTDADRYLQHAHQAPYMIDAFDTSEDGQRDLCAAMHPSDKTVRPQILRYEDNPAYYRLIEAFKAQTGIGAVMNTSFNLHGHPLVTNLNQALFTLRHSDLRYLAMGSYLIEKR